MTRRLLALLLTLCLILSAVPAVAGAATEQRVTANAVTVTAGNTATVTLKAEGFENIATLEVYVYYDATALTLSSTGNGSLLSGAQTSVNTAEAGTVKLVTMSLNGINGSGNLLTIYFKTATDCIPGTYPITVAIGNVYDTAFAATTIESANGSVTVNKPVATETFSLYGYPSKTTLKKGDTLSYRVASASSSRAFVSGEFTLEYDHELFAFDSATLESALTAGDAVYSVNSSVLGQVRIAYASTDPVKSFYLFTVKLTVVGDTDTTTKVTAEATNMYREDLSLYLPGTCTSTLTLQKTPEVIDNPDAFLETEKLIVGRQSKSVFTVQAGAGIAAADFTVTYDPAVLRCVSVNKLETVTEQGGMVVINDNFANGTIRFSYVNMDGSTEVITPVEITWEPLQSPAAHYEIALSGAGVVDTQQKDIDLEYVTDSGCIYQPVVTLPTCLEDGYTTYICDACGDSYIQEPTNKLGHELVHHESKMVTCSEVGWNAYDTCSRCDYTTYVEIAAKGHDFVHHEAKAETCTEIGWNAYDTCSRCDYTTYVEIPAKGHDLVHHEAKAETCTEIGWNAYDTCSRCDYTTYVEIAAKGHDLVHHEAKAETCTEIGWNAYDTCSRCDYTTYVEISAKGHDLVHHEAKAETCTEIGWNAYDTCSRCDYTTYVEIAAKGHDLVHHDAKAETCTEIGWNAYDTCSRCDYTTYVEIPAKGHDEILHEAKAPTCTDIGWEEYVTCSRCDYTTYEEISAKGHDLVHHDAKAETCTDIGWEEYVTCSRCDYTTYVEIAAKGHDLVHHEAKAPTFTEIGWDAYVTCSRCDYTTYVEIPAKGDHIPGDINGDGNVDNKDVTRLFQYLSDWDVDVVEAALDVNGDGSVDNKDLTRLFQYMSDWDVEIH